MFKQYLEMALAKNAEKLNNYKDKTDNPEGYYLGAGSQWFLHLSSTPDLKTASDIKKDIFELIAYPDSKPRGGFWLAPRGNWVRALKYIAGQRVGKDKYLYKIKINLENILLGRGDLTRLMKQSELSTRKDDIFTFKSEEFHWDELKKKGIDLGKHEGEYVMRQKHNKDYSLKFTKTGKPAMEKVYVTKWKPNVKKIDGIWFYPGDAMDLQSIDVESLVLFNSKPIEEIKFIGEFDLNKIRSEDRKIIKARSGW